MAFFITERHVIKTDVAAYHGHYNSAGYILNDLGFVDRLEDALHIRHIHDDGVIHVRDIVYRPPEPADVPDERHNDADGNPVGPADPRRGADIKKRDRPDRDVLRRRDEQKHYLDGLHPRIPYTAGYAKEDAHIFVFAYEPLRDLHAGNALVDIRVKVRRFRGISAPSGPLLRFYNIYRFYNICFYA